MGRLEGKVAFITGAARGQGRSHAVKLAQEGADIIAVDIAAQIPSVPYPMATPDDLAETVRQVEALDRRIVAREADVRDLAALQAVVAEGQAELGPIDIILANAGIGMSAGGEGDLVTAWQDVIDTNLTGVYNTVMAAVPSLIEQEAGAIVLTSSTQGLKGTGGNGDPGGTAYAAAKHGVVGLMRTFAHWLGPKGIRVNTVHPTGVNTPMIRNEIIEQMFADGNMDAVTNIIPIPWVEPIDISNAIAFLVSDEGRYVTGVAFPVDAGFSAR
ncbi:mycofactocin-coupled SDR family oxidoreductase [Agromyces archimandritae]|uniref:Mycofactocin-coupled SDR family oxidoreductase n=1 Tax=Agromyces archimandritae TaxID=2781962 RepID=A0A975FNL4_9MICO|nr:mycofactocin-coupled SDR family oxidoreductase [Agromyces archimandritae]QTX04321.1 mycofactocin-coupled SDR family oxidoreductase [Agromyces archimandritae]